MILNAHLDPTVKKKWLAALRSRQFKQGKGQLFDTDDNTYCCLGVLAKVQGLDSNKNNVDMGDSFLPAEVAAKLFHCNKGVAMNLQSHLGVRNDGGKDWDNKVDDQDVKEYKPQRFYQIARWIERNL